MNKKFFIPVLVIIVTISVFLILISEDSSIPSSENLYQYGFTFYDIEKIDSALSKNNFYMSTPSAITDHTIGQYCQTLDDKGNFYRVEYCTTTAIQSPDGKSLGNINMGGDIDNPVMALGIIDSSPFVDSKFTETKIVFEILIDTLVCDCWEEKQPGGFASVGDWLNAAQMKYTESSKTTLTSKIHGLGDESLMLEITSKDDSYLWTLVILK